MAAQLPVANLLDGLISYDGTLPQVSEKLFDKICRFDDVFMAFHVNDQPLMARNIPYSGDLFLVSAGPSASGKDDVMGKPGYTPDGMIVFKQGTALDRLSGITVDDFPIITPDQIGRPVKVTNRRRRPRYLNDANDRPLKVPVLVDGKLELRMFEILGPEVSGSHDESVSLLVNALKRVEDSNGYLDATSYLRDFESKSPGEEERKRVLELTGRTDVSEAVTELRSLHRELSEMLYEGGGGGARDFVGRQVLKKGSGEINGVDYWFLRHQSGKIGGRYGDFRKLEDEGVFDVGYTYSKSGYGFVQNAKPGLYATYQMTCLSFDDAVEHISEEMVGDPVLAEVVSRYATGGKSETSRETIEAFIKNGSEVPSLRRENPRATDGTVTMQGLKDFAESDRYKLVLLGSGTTPEAEVILMRYSQSELSYLIQGSRDRPVEDILDDMKRFQALRGTEHPAKQEDRRVECGPHIRRALNLVGDHGFNPSGHRIHILENHFDESPEKALLDKSQRLAAIMLAARVTKYDSNALQQIVSQLAPGKIPIEEADIEGIGIPSEFLSPESS